MRQHALFLLTLLLAWDRPASSVSNCNTIWTYKTDAYQQGSTYAGSKPAIPDTESCLATCARAFTDCTGCEVRKGNCWIFTKPIQASLLQDYVGTMQYSLVQRCDPEFCSAHWLEAATNSTSYAYPEAYPLSAFDRGYLSKCLSLCAANSRDPCYRVVYCPSTGGEFDPYGSSCSLEGNLDGPTPSGCINYQLKNDCL